jgi:Flp pilus assembly protein TadD
VELLPFFVIGAAFGLNTAWLEREQVGAVGRAWDLSLAERAIVAGRALWFYAGKLVWPHRLTFVYPRWRVEAASPAQYLPLVGAVASALVLWVGRRRLGRGPLAGMVFFMVSLAPALGFFAVYPMRFSFVADHFQYLASIGLIALGIASAVRLAERVGDGRTVPWTVAGGVLLAGLGALTFCQARAYRDERTLWEDTLVKNPTAWIAHNNLGPLLFDAGEADRAIGHLEEALRLNPGLYEAHVNLARVLESRGQYDDAEEHYRAALSVKPDHAQAHNNLGCLLRARYRLDEAIEHLGLAVDARPDYEVARQNLALTLGLRHAAEASVAERRRAVEADPGHAGARARLGLALTLRGRLDEAEEELRSALSADPELVEAHSHLGRVLAARGRREEAVVEFRWALALQPAYADAQRGLDRLLGSDGPADADDEGQRTGGSAAGPAAP